MGIREQTFEREGVLQCGRVGVFLLLDGAYEVALIDEWGGSAQNSFSPELPKGVLDRKYSGDGEHDGVKFVHNFCVLVEAFEQYAGDCK
jgi:hypothetical protein